jgi:hypothetical protein
MNGGGLFELNTPRHLLGKAIHDIERLRVNRLDTYAAFDFFVTARHIPDWLYLDNSTKRDALFGQHVELRICRHLADGAKHFLVTHPRHEQVSATVRTHDVWGGSWGGSWASRWGKNELMIHLDPADVDTKKLGSSISALDLAEMVLMVLKQIVP